MLQILPKHKAMNFRSDVEFIAFDRCVGRAFDARGGTLSGAFSSSAPQHAMRPFISASVLSLA